MANVSRNFGFRPAKSSDGKEWMGLIRFYTAADRSADTTNNHGDIYRGDPVKITSGLVLPANSGDTVLGVVVSVGTATSTMQNGATGYFNPNNLMQNYADLATTTGMVVGVIPATDCLFEIEEASDLDLVQGQAADFSTDATEAHGSRTTGLSSVKLVTATHNDVRVVEYQTSPSNDRTITAAKFLVKFLIV